MKTILIILGFIIVLVIACVVSWHYGEHHELHKVRAEFADVLKHLGPSSRFRQGLEAAEKIVNEMDKNWNGNYCDYTSKYTEDNSTHD